MKNEGQEYSGSSHILQRERNGNSKRSFNRPSDQKTFFMKDPFGNLFQITESNDWFMNTDHISGGPCGAIIGVTDINRAEKLYSDILGYDRVVFDTTGTFSDLAVFRRKENIRRVLLTTSLPSEDHSAGYSDAA